MIAYDAVRLARARGEIDPALEGEAARQALLRHWLNQPLLRHWLNQPSAMERARAEGPRRLFTQRRMVTLDDYAERLAEHPLVRRAHAQRTWSGAWDTLQVAVILAGGVALDATDAEYPPPLRHAPAPGHRPLPRRARPVPGGLGRAPHPPRPPAPLSGRLPHGRPGGVAPGRPPGGHRHGPLAARGARVLPVGGAPGGTPGPGHRPRRLLRAQYPDRADSGHIPLDGLEIAVCDDDPRRPARGYYRLTLHGGRRG